MFVVTLPASVDAEAYARSALKAGASLLEVRGDLCPDLESFDCGLPIIATPRGQDASWIRRFEPRYVDLDLAEDVSVPDGVELIRSHHDYTATPVGDEMEATLDRLCSSGADHCKLATTIREYDDIARLEQCRDRLPEGAIVLGMGEKAHVQRLLGASHNAWTYACLDSSGASAPGQIDIATHALFEHTEKPRLFGVLGGPSLSSRGPATHGRWLREHAVDAIYAQFPCADFEAAFRQLVALGVQGFSVTSPHKTSAFQIADECDALVEELGAANTLVRDGTRWVAHTTDIEGIVRGYPMLRSAASVRILGAGGVVPAVIRACRELGVDNLEIWARRPEQALELSRRFGTAVASTPDKGAVDALICTIPGDVDVTLPPVGASGLAIDLRYGRDTPFLRRAAALGYETHDGSSMFEHQARAQFRLFTGIEIHGEQ